jgi:hypothetical protein
MLRRLKAKPQIPQFPLEVAKVPQPIGGAASHED